jgi:hypothetical protein
VAPGLLRVLAQIERHFGGRQLHLMSGYRARDDGVLEVPHLLAFSGGQQAIRP